MPKKNIFSILRNTWEKILEQNLFIVSAGVTFYWLLGFVPGVSAIVSIYGLIADKEDVEKLFAAADAFFPGVTFDFLQSQISSIAEQSVTAGFGALGSIIFALWINFNAVKNLMKACNIICLVPKDERNFWEFHLIALAFTLAATVFSIISIFVISAGPLFIEKIELGGTAAQALNLLRWPVMAAAGLAGLTVFYKYGPYRKGRWKWASWGAITATLLWLTASYLFSLYVDSFQSYNKMYGSFGWVIAVMLWFWISVGAVLFGANINQQMESDD